MLAHYVFHVAEHAVDGSYRVVQVYGCAVGSRQHFLPIPLIYLQTMDFIGALEGADGVHVGVDAVAWLGGNAPEFDAFPLGKGMNNLAMLAEFGYKERHGFFNACEVIIETVTGFDEQRRRDATKV